MFNNDDSDPRRYDDLLALPHHVSSTRRHMTMAERAAQFAPFAALTGHSAAIMEAARLTDRRIEPGEAEQAELDAKLRILRERLDERPRVRVTYFVPDPLKEGGRYDTEDVVVRRILPTEYALLLEDGRTIDIDEILGLEGELYENIQF